jgi:hypothetical protein
MSLTHNPLLTVEQELNRFFIFVIVSRFAVALTPFFILLYGAREVLSATGDIHQAPVNRLVDKTLLSAPEHSEAIYSDLASIGLVKPQKTLLRPQRPFSTSSSSSVKVNASEENGVQVTTAITEVNISEKSVQITTAITEVNPIKPVTVPITVAERQVTQEQDPLVGKEEDLQQFLTQGQFHRLESGTLPLNKDENKNGDQVSVRTTSKQTQKTIEIPQADLLQIQESPPDQGEFRGIEPDSASTWPGEGVSTRAADLMPVEVKTTPDSLSQYLTDGRFHLRSEVQLSNQQQFVIADTHLAPFTVSVNPEELEQITATPFPIPPTEPTQSNPSGIEIEKTPNKTQLPATPNETQSPATPNETQSPATPNQTQSPATPSKPQLPPKFIILPLGINVGETNIVPSTTVKGLENGKEAVDFDNWLVPFSSVTQALRLKVTPKDNGQLELRSASLVINFDPSILVNDPDIGQAISVAQIRNILQTPTEFSIAEYAIIFSPPWLTTNLDGRQYQEKEASIILEGLPQIDPPFFSFTGISQRINVSQQAQTNNFGNNNNNSNYDSDIRVLGSIAGGSLFSGVQQSSNNANSSWQLNDLQYFHPSPYTDYIVGTQAPFWNSLTRNNSGNYLGFTVVQRQGYLPSNDTNFSFGGVNAQQRLNGNQVVRTVSGEAEPGTLVQLVTQNSNLIVAEQLVDSSGKYEFEKVITAANVFGGTGQGRNYKLLLYPKGNLSAKPEEISLNYLNLRGQINQGKSAFVLTAGTGTKQNSSNQNLFGNFDNLQAGAGYYWGLSDEITLGTGIVYDNSTRPYTEILYQPVNFPLTFRLGVLVDNQNDINADVRYTTGDFRLSFGGYQDSFGSNLSWSLSPELSLFSNWYSGGRDNGDGLGLETGFNLNLQPISLSLSYETTNSINWFLRADFKPLLIGTRKYRQQTYSELFYSLSGDRFFDSTGYGVRLVYQTDDENYLASANWIYRTPLPGTSGRNLLDLELGYGKGSQGSGLIASASTNVIPGIGLRLTYSQVSLTDNNSSLSLGLFTSLLTQPNLNLNSDEGKLEKLRTQGGIILQPFLDRNNNGLRDEGEDFYTQDIELLFLINNQPLNRLGIARAEVVDDGASFELPPDTYRLDIDPAGFPLGWKAVEPAYAVRVAPGAYTTVSIPLIPSYVVTGRVTDQEGNSMIGASVQFVSRSNPKTTITSVTNSAGIYYLEDLKPDVYDLVINGKPAQQNTLEINANSETFLELNLQP